jgi:signal recognition particle receptor subunit beta
MRTSYLRGSSGYMLVVDGTRHETLEKAVVLQNRTEETLGKVPFVLVLNKTDLVDNWEVDDSAIEELGKRGWPAFRTSAKTGEGVEQAFLALARKMAGSSTT